jgi:hypothetical protein
MQSGVPPELDEAEELDELEELEAPELEELEELDELEEVEELEVDELEELDELALAKGSFAPVHTAAAISQNAVHGSPHTPAEPVGLGSPPLGPACGQWVTALAALLPATPPW